MNHGLNQNDPLITFDELGTPRSGRFEDIYYSLQDGLAESRAVFLEGVGIPELWRHQDHCLIAELGFGTGLNLLAVIEAWDKTRDPHQRLHLFSIEAYLMDQASAAKALRAWPELGPYAEALLAQWPQKRQGFHYIDLPQWGVQITLALMDVKEALEAFTGQAEAWFLDGFSPALNPDMWSPEVFRAIAQHAHNGTRLASFTVAGHVRRGLAEVGFEPRKMPGFGKKRERLEAVFINPDKPKPLPLPRRPKIAIIGAGIAGVSLAYQARLLGLEAEIFESQGLGAGASGNRAGLLTPRLDAGAPVISGLFADAFAYARTLYQGLAPEAILGQGVWQAQMTERDAKRFEKIITQPYYADQSLRRFEEGEVPELAQKAGLYLSEALRFEPLGVLQALLGPQSLHLADIKGYEQRSDGVYLHTASKALLGPFDQIFLTLGQSIFDFTLEGQAAALGQSYDLRAVRGQVEFAPHAEALDYGLSWGGYLIGFKDGYVFGASHERDDRSEVSRDHDRHLNLENLSRIDEGLRQALDTDHLISRARVRVMTRDYLPFCGALDERVFTLSGLGARGFCLGPLLAKDLLAQALGLPRSLQKPAQALIAPKRLRF